MSHPIMFDDANPYLSSLRKICLSLPGAAEKVSHGRPVFYTTKMFATFGGTVKGDHSSGRYDDSVLFVPDDEERLALQEDERFFLPAYFGPWGWLGLDFRKGEVDWGEVAELVEMSYRQTAGRALVAELDERFGADHQAQRKPEAR